MIKNDWIVGARFNYERGTLFPRYIALLSARNDRGRRARRAAPYSEGANF